MIIGSKDYFCSSSKKTTKIEMRINTIEHRLICYTAATLLFVSFLTAKNVYGVEANVDISQFSVNDIQRQLPGGLGKSNFPLDDAKALFRNKCIEVAGDKIGNNVYTEIELGIATLGECVNNLVNYTAIQTEIDEASPRGELDIVFNKYCSKRPKALECIETFNAKLVPCLDKNEHESQEVLMRIVRSLLNFVCHKGGDQIALFIAEKGPECLESKMDEIQQCFNNTFAGYFPKDSFDTVTTLPKLIMGQKQCDDIITLENCIVERLEHCSEITPANIVESMFRFIKNETICRTTLGTSTANQSATNHCQSLKSPIVFMFMLLFTKLFF